MIEDLGKLFLEEHTEAKRKPSTAREYQRLLEVIVNPPVCDPFSAFQKRHHQTLVVSEAGLLKEAAFNQIIDAVVAVLKSSTNRMNEGHRPRRHSRALQTDERRASVSANAECESRAPRG